MPLLGDAGEWAADSNPNVHKGEASGPERDA